MLPVDGAPYPLVLRGPGYAPGRSVLGVVLGLSLFVLLTGLVSQVVIVLGWALTAGDVVYADYARQALAFERPVGMLGANLGIATLIPIACGILWLVHRVHPRWLASVRPGLRWRYLLVCLGIALVSLNGVLLLSQLAAPDRPAVGLQPGFWGFLVVILLTSPLQAAAEEIFFRGYLLQALGSLVSQPWFGVVVSSVVFALLHGTQNLPLFVDRLAFGLLAAVLVWRTGGLEAGIAAHVVNNVFAYVFAGATTGIAALKAVREIGWLDALFDVGGFAVFAVLAHLAFRALKLRHVVDLDAAGTVVR
ncbi:lysostaphin resistance A-like protein [Microlunatus capsulatus]|uniref:Membrane protease YdiL (CAAX protease family) n=1 Tax=Microlunatus capsulatus TaxID=99117 RepID=A0ABS4ZCL5_9ACTN|nr:CPBP family intramembrane glutamic endopeptidase [Microlunatus capsulatus]MBP2418809.1 membrane protease YdiL (CAAX protease family) [Microlunatus capsulatus]